MMLLLPILIPWFPVLPCIHQVSAQIPSASLKYLRLPPSFKEAPLCYLHQHQVLVPTTAPTTLSIIELSAPTPRLVIQEMSNESKKWAKGLSRDFLKEDN